jgi:hypothetical protein
VKTSPKRSYSVIENERFGLVFAKTVSIISGTGVMTNLVVFIDPGWGDKVNYGIVSSYRPATLQRKSHLCFLFMGIARPQSQFPLSCVYERFIYKSLTDTWRWKLGLWPCNSFSVNISFEFSDLVLLWAGGPARQPYAGVDFIPQSWIYEFGYCTVLFQQSEL